MGYDSIEILGITPVSNFPQCPPHHPCTEFCEIDKLCIPCHKITIESIRQICFKVCINSFKIICTPAGKKLVIDGKKQIKVLFVSDDPHQSIRCADFEIPFCTFVLLKNIQDEVIQVCSVVEDVSVKCLDCRCLAVTSIIFVCPVFKKDYHLFTDHTSHEKQQCNCHAPYDKQQCNCHTPYDKQQFNCHTPHNHNLQSMCKNCQSYFNN